jgi:hypothetical protein
MQGLDNKVIVFKYKRKKHYRRTIGHRQVLKLSFYFAIQLLSKSFAIKMSKCGQKESLFIKMSSNA